MVIILLHPYTLASIHIASESFSPPNDVRLINVQPGQITFSWTSVDALCDSISYNIISSNCGTCPITTTNTTATCTDVVASGQVCTFIVQTVVCGSIIGILSNPTTVILKGTCNVINAIIHLSQHSTLYLSLIHI